MDKIKIHNLKVKLRVLNDNLLKASQEINNITDSVQISENAQITDIPKSAPFNVRVEETLDALHERIRQIELYLGLYIKEQPEPEPQKERKIVFKYWIGEDGSKKSPIHNPSDFYEVIEIYKIVENKYLFAAKDKTWIYPYIYIGHYE
jgi:hypothetical protein